MTNKQQELLNKRFILDIQKYNFMEPEEIKRQNDLLFCKDFFGKEYVDGIIVYNLLRECIEEKNEEDLDFLIMLIEHFKVVKDYRFILAELLTQPWHHFHDNIARILEFNVSEDLSEYLYKGALYSCENLEYQSDYKEFNRKCIYALAKIGTKKSNQYIKQISNCGDEIIANIANKIMENYSIK